MGRVSIRGITLIVTILFSLCLQAQIKPYVVASNDCGVPEKQPFLVKGENYELPKTYQGTEASGTCNFGSSVIYAFDKLDINADYFMELSFMVDGERVIEIKADGNVVCAPITVRDGEEVRQTIQLPRKAYAYGQLVLVFEALKGPNAIISELNILSSKDQRLLPFDGEEKRSLASAQRFAVNDKVDVESVLPTYAPIPKTLVETGYTSILLNKDWLFSSEEKGEKWSQIEVPGQWNMQNFKVDSAGWCRYKTVFNISRDWSDKMVRLRFDGVHSEYKVMINGKESGYHLGGMTPYEIDITKNVEVGENTLELKVRSESLADMLGSLTQYAAHQLGGITRKVTLFVLPKVCIEDIRVITDLDSFYTNATLKVFARIANHDRKTIKGASLMFVLSDERRTSARLKLPSLRSGQSWSGWIDAEVPVPNLWDNEHPHLYTLSVSLESKAGAETIEKRIGFREVEVRGNEMYVNGKAVKLRGVCRHESHPLTGRVLTAEQRLQDALLYRDANCNFIRTSHYPPAEEFIDYCDSLGLFVELEAPICWIGHHANENWKYLNYRDSIYYDYVLQANMEMIQFYRNHPSVVMWSMANESYWNKGFAQVAVYVGKADPTRPYAFHDQSYGGFNNQGSMSPIANIHYPGPNGYKEAAKSDRPMTYGEYCHLNVYNRSELVTDPGVRSDWALALAPTWENMYHTKGVLGGSIWSGIDDVFQMPDGNAVGYGAWGPIDGWRRPKPEYWDMKKVYSPIRVLTEKLEQSDALEIKLENRYTFAHPGEVKMSWTYGKEQGTQCLMLKPQTEGVLTINVADPGQANELYLSFEDPRGFTVDEYLIPVGKQEQNSLPIAAKIPTQLKITKESYLIVGTDFKCEISKKDGQIISFRKKENELINGGPMLMALPLNGGGCYPDHNANTPIFNDLCTDWSVKSIEAQRVGNDVEIKVAGSYKEFKGSYRMIINAGGQLSVSYEFESLCSVNPRQWGLVFSAPRNFDKLFWRRKGLWSVYPADHIARPVGEAVLFDKNVPSSVSARVKPSWPWSSDFNELGSNDFRSTRRNIWYAGLENSLGQQIMVHSDGTQHWRSWLASDKIKFLVADFASPGYEMFLEGHYAPHRRPIKMGDKINGTVILRTK